MPNFAAAQKDVALLTTRATSTAFPSHHMLSRRGHKCTLGQAPALCPRAGTHFRPLLSVPLCLSGLQPTQTERRQVFYRPKHKLLCQHGSHLPLPKEARL